MIQDKNALTLGQNPNTPTTEARTNLVNSPVAIPGGDPSSRLMGTRIVRIRFATKCACIKGCKKYYYQINTISRIDDLNPQNENELPLFDAEQIPQCDFCPMCCPPMIKYEFTDSTTKELFCVSETRAQPERVRVCCGESYYVFPPVYNFKASNVNDVTVVERYDSRSFYRTFGYPEQPLYKIGEPYIPVEVSCSCRKCCAALPCCADCCDERPVKDEPCCSCCCEEAPNIKRKYIDIFNMANQVVGKYAEFYDVSGCLCCTTKTLFYEVYFPADANDMLRLALISQMILFLHFRQNLFGTLPGTLQNLEQFVN